MKIIECKNIDTENHQHIKFIRIQPEELSITIREILESLSDVSWISRFDKPYMQISFKKRAKDTARYLADKILKNDSDSVTADSGEYIVSELARKALVQELKYFDIPLAELFKEQKSGNPGFDFYSVNNDDIIVFGEAKYSSSKNAYGLGMEQVDRFIKEEQDIADLNDIDKFLKDESLMKAVEGEKAYAIAFASKDIATDKLISNIKKNKYYVNLAKQKEVIYLAVNV